MADDRRDPHSTPLADEERLRGRLRRLAIVVVLALLVLLVVVDLFGRLLVRHDFHVSEVFLATITGALLVLLGVEGVARLPFGGGGR